MRPSITAVIVTVVTLMGCLGWPSPTVAASLPKELAPLGFLLGEWDGGGSGTPGQGSGGTSFATGLQDRVIVRTNFAIVAATDKTPASRHDDLMIIYVDDRRVVRADYYDNEGHVIRYLIETPADGRAVFTSEASAAGPRYRLTYEASAGGSVKGAFLLAPPGKPDAFTPYLTWEMRRARSLFQSSENEVFLSAGSAWEIAIKHALGRLPLPDDPARFLPEMREAHGIEPLPADEASALHIARLPALHRDPFDRLLVSQAIVHGLTILTPDPLVTQYPARTLW